MKNPDTFPPIIMRMETEALENESTLTNDHFSTSMLVETEITVIPWQQSASSAPPHAIGAFHPNPDGTTTVLGRLWDTGCCQYVQGHISV